MTLENCCWCNLRIGIYRFALISTILSTIFVMLHFAFSLSDDDPAKAETHTLFIGAHLLNIGIKGSLSYGAYKESRVFLLPYLIVECIALSIITVVCILFMFQSPILIIILLVTALFWYIWFCVLSLYQMLDPLNPNYVPKQLSSSDTAIHIERPNDVIYYENKLADAV